MFLFANYLRTDEDTQLTECLLPVEKIRCVIGIKLDSTAARNALAKLRQDFEKYKNSTGTWSESFPFLTNNGEKIPVRLYCENGVLLFASIKLQLEPYSTEWIEYLEKIHQSFLSQTEALFAPIEQNIKIRDSIRSKITMDNGDCYFVYAHVLSISHQITSKQKALHVQQT